MQRTRGLRGSYARIPFHADPPQAPPALVGPRLRRLCEFSIPTALAGNGCLRFRRAPLFQELRAAVALQTHSGGDGKKPGSCGAPRAFADGGRRLGTAGERPNPILSFRPSYNSTSSGISPWIIEPGLDFTIETGGKRDARHAPKQRRSIRSARLELEAAAWKVRERCPPRPPRDSCGAGDARPVSLAGIRAIRSRASP